jgi:restriction system protein
MSVAVLLDILMAIFQALVFIWPVWLILSFIAILRLTIKLYMQRRFMKAGMDDVDRLTGEGFEEYLAFLFERLGYKVTMTPVQGDFGADLILEQEGEHTAVQAKCFSGTVGVNAVQQVVAAKGYYQCNRAMVVTNSYFSLQAQKLAKANHIVLWDRKKLTKVVLSLKKSEPQIQDPPTDILDGNAQDSEFGAKRSSNSYSCKMCNASVTPRVRQFCLDRPQVFAGKVYCMKCQSLIKNSKLVTAS